MLSIKYKKVSSNCTNSIKKTKRRWKLAPFHRPIIEPIGDFKTLLARCDLLARECGKRQFRLAP
jgi:hypothetical protein